MAAHTAITGNAVDFIDTPRPAMNRPPPASASTVPAHIGDFRHIGFNGKPVTFGWLSNDFYPDGYIGDPTPATAELGRTLFDGAVRGFCEALREISEFNYGRPV